MGLRSEEGGRRRTVCVIFLPSKEGVGGSLYCVEFDQRTFFFVPDPDPGASMSNSVEVSGVLVTGADTRRPLNLAWSNDFVCSGNVCLSCRLFDSRGGVGGRASKFELDVEDSCKTAADSFMAAAASSVPVVC